MRGELFPGHVVELDGRTKGVSGSWTAKTRNSLLLAWNQNALAFFLARMLEYESPLVYDVGANTGSFCLLAKYHPTARFVAFEPEPFARKVLSRNIALNGLQDRVEVSPLALSDRDGFGELKVPTTPDRLGYATLGTPSFKGQWKRLKVPLRRLDSLKRRPDILKIDTEGSELFVLRGGENLIRKYIPDILVEATGKRTRQFGYGKDEIASLLRKWGYLRRKRVGKEDWWFTIR